MLETNFGLGWLKKAGSLDRTDDPLQVNGLDYASREDAGRSVVRDVRRLRDIGNAQVF
jgi:hypothetical protein